MPLLEIVRTQQTSAQVIVDLLDVGKKIKKTPVVVGNCTGFAVNRMFFPYSQAAILLVEHGTDVYQIDQAITKFGMPMGVFRYVIFKIVYVVPNNAGVFYFSCLCALQIKCAIQALIFVFSFSHRMIDLVGFGVAIATGTQFVINFPERSYKSMLIPIMQEDKRAGVPFPRIPFHLITSLLAFAFVIMP